MPSHSRAAVRPADPDLDPLERYRGKRDFGRSPEPAGKPSKAAAGHAYLIQKHAARRLHYDLRLELGGTLKSWAVPQGPSLDPADRRLAVHVEDHPLDYGQFEGLIPKGEYGGGTVMLWDRGAWNPIGNDAARDYAQGKLKFQLSGEKLRGAWMLVRMGVRSREEGKDLWLLIKERDEHARVGGGLPDDDLSVLSHRSMADIAAAGDRVWRGARDPTLSVDAPSPGSDRGSATLPPAFVEPQLATLVDQAPSGQEWLHEIKLDGYRCQVRLVRGEVTIHTRGGHDWTDRFRALANAAAALPARDALFDGEIVVLDGGGVSSFAALKEALHTGRQDDMVLYAFDLLHLDGADLRSLPLLERKRRLEDFISAAPDSSRLRYSDHVLSDGPHIVRQACRLGAEGIVSKRTDAPYRSGRSRTWLKVKCTSRQEFVIGGYTARRGGGSGLGALLLGVHDGDPLVHVGRVGTGWSEEEAERLLAQLAPRRQVAIPYEKLARAARAGAYWVRPELVVEIAFAGWTADGNLRHASFVALREDRNPRSVARERPQPLPAIAPPRPRGLAAGSSSNIVVAGVRVSHADRVVLDEPRLTRGDLVRYYAAVAGLLLPAIAGRPVSLIRCPDRLGHGCFYQRHRAAGMPPEVRSVRVDGEREDYVAVDDERGLLSLVQFGATEFHPWGARADRPDRPDRLIFDLDPDEGLPWAKVVAAAHEVRERLDRLGLRSFAKTTGGKGLHVVVPIDRRYMWPEVKSFAGNLAREMAHDSPRAYTATLAKVARRGRIFIDYLRNDRTATAVAAYSLRGRPGAPVSMPIAWPDVTERLEPRSFTILTAASLGRGRNDPWQELAGLRQRLPVSTPGSSSAPAAAGTPNAELLVPPAMPSR